MLDTFTQCLLAGIVIGIVVFALDTVVAIAAHRRKLVALLAVIVAAVLAFVVSTETPRLLPLLICFYTVLSVALGTGELLFVLLKRRDKPQPTSSR